MAEAGPADCRQRLARPAPKPGATSAVARGLMVTGMACNADGQVHEAPAQKM